MGLIHKRLQHQPGIEWVLHGARGAGQRPRPLRQSGHRATHASFRQVSHIKKPGLRAGFQRQQVMAQLMQGIDGLHGRPVLHCADVAALHGPGQRGPACGVAAGLRKQQGVVRPAARRLEHRLRLTGRKALGLQPVQRLLRARPNHLVGQAAAANGRQQLVRGFAGQYKLHVARGLFKRLEQRVRGDVVHALGRKNQDRLASPPRTGALRKLHRIAHGFNADFLAGLAFFIVNLALRLFTEWPAKAQHNGLRHQHAQVGMGAHIDRVAAAADATRALPGCCVAQPGARHLQRQTVLPQPGRPGQQPRVAALRQQ